MTVIKCLFNGVEVPTCSDSGSDLIVLGWNHYKNLTHRLGYDFDLVKTNQPAYAANGSRIHFVGKTTMTLASKYASKTYDVFIQNTAMKGLPLLSELALIELGYIKYSKTGEFAKNPTLNSVKSITLDNYDHLHAEYKLKLTKLHDKYKCCFQGIGRLRNFKAKFTVKAHAQGFVKTCLPVPLHLKKAVEEKLQYLIKNNVLEHLPPNTPAKYVCSLICIPKPNNDVRICANLKPLNSILERIGGMCAPRLEQFQDKLRNCKYYGSVDVKESYFQIGICEETSNLCVISTPIGILRFKTLPMGASPSGDILDQRMAILLKDCHHSINVRDDIIFGSETMEGLFTEYEKILEAMKKNGLTLNKQKVKFGLLEIDFFGQIFSANGMKPSKKRIADLQAAEFPANQRGVLSFVCMLQWLERYICRFASESRSLRDLSLTKGPMQVTEEHRTAFEKLKSAISEETLLAHFNPSFNTVVFTDAGKTAHQPGSRGGLCSILCQTNPQNPTEFIPICFSSRIMTKVEANYSQVEAECLAIVYGVLKYSYFLEGCPKFTVFTDAKSLIPMFNKMNQSSCPKRIFSLFLKIQHFSGMSLEYRVGKMNPSDFLSRSPNQAPPNTNLVGSDEIETALIQSIQSGSDKMCLQLIREHTLQDEELISVSKRIQNHDWDHHKKQLKGYYSQREEFYVIDDVVFRNGKIVIPVALRATVTKLIHNQGHLGMTGTKQLLQQHFWWPNFSDYCISEVQKCFPCQFTSRPRIQQPGGFYMPEAKVCYSISADFKGPINAFDSYYILALVCLYSGWSEVFYTTTTSFKVVKPKLLDYMARHSKIKYLISDNGPPFDSREMKQFCIEHNIHQKPIVQLNPAANGVVESFNKSLEKAISRASILKTNYRDEIAQMLIAKMSIPMPGTLKSPYELVYKQKSNLNFLPDYQFPSMTDNSGAQQNLLDYKKATKARHDKNNSVYNREFHVNDLVLVCPDLHSGKKKKFSKDLYKVTDVKPSYLIATRLRDGQTLRRTKNHFKIFVEDTTQQLQHQPQRKSKPAITNENEFIDDDIEPQNLIPPRPPPQLPAEIHQQQQLPVNPPQIVAPPQVPPAPAPPQQARAQHRVNFNPIVNVQEIPHANMGRRITRSMAPVEDHPNVQPGILEASHQQQRQANERIQQFQQQQQDQDQNNQNQSLIQERHSY